jgi:hypothetical protein
MILYYLDTMILKLQNDHLFLFCRSTFFPIFADRHIFPISSRKLINCFNKKNFISDYIHLYCIISFEKRLFKTFNLTENCHFGYVGLPSKYGSWELLEYQTQSVSTAKRYQAMMLLLNETSVPVAPLNFTCSGILFNDSNVCGKGGFCVSENNCDAFGDVYPQADISILPKVGYALTDLFYLSTSQWFSDLPIKYAFG